MAVGNLSSRLSVSITNCRRERTLLPLMAVAGSKVGLRNCLVCLVAVVCGCERSCVRRKFRGADDLDVAVCC